MAQASNRRPLGRVSPKGAASAHDKGMSRDTYRETRPSSGAVRIRWALVEMGFLWLGANGGRNGFLYPSFLRICGFCVSAVFCLAFSLPRFLDLLFSSLPVPLSSSKKPSLAAREESKQAGNPSSPNQRAIEDNRRQTPRPKK